MRALLLLLLPSIALAQPATVTVTHAGYLLGVNDQPVTAQVGMKFLVWDTASGGALLWTGEGAGSAPCSVDVAAGYYSVTLGAGCGSGLTSAHVPPGSTRWLELVVGGTTLAPRVALVPAPAAVRAADADAIGGVAAAAFLNTTTGRVLPAAIAPGTAPIDVTGNAATVTNGLYSSGSYADPAWLTQVAGAKISGAVATATSAASAAAFTGTLAGDVTGTQGATVLSKLQGRTVAPTAPTDGQALVWNQANAQWQPGTVATSSGSVPSSNGEPASPSVGQMIYDTAVGAAKLWDGSRWIVLARSGQCGASSDTPATSCKAIRQDCGITTDATYWLVEGSTVFQAWCDLSTDSGGWTRCLEQTLTNGNRTSTGKNLSDTRVDGPLPPLAWVSQQCNVTNATTQFLAKGTHAGTLAMSLRATAAADWLQVSAGYTCYSTLDLANGNLVRNLAVIRQSAAVSNVCGLSGSSTRSFWAATPAPLGAAQYLEYTFHDGDQYQSIGGADAFQKRFEIYLRQADGTGTACGNVASRAATSCKAIKDSCNVTQSGRYWLTDGSTPFQVYCDMATDGGGWALVGRYINNPVNSGNMAVTSAVGTLTSPSQASFAKLDDAVWNQLRIASGSSARLRIQDASNVTLIFEDVGNGVAISNNTQTFNSYKYSTTLNGTYVNSVGLGCNPHLTNWDAYNAGGIQYCHHGGSGGSAFDYGGLYLSAQAVPGTIWIR